MNVAQKMTYSTLYVCLGNSSRQGSVQRIHRPAYSQASLQGQFSCFWHNRVVSKYAAMEASAKGDMTVLSRIQQPCRRSALLFNPLWDQDTGGVPGAFYNPRLLAQTVRCFAFLVSFCLICSFHFFSFLFISCVFLSCLFFSFFCFFVFSCLPAGAPPSGCPL